MSSTKPVTVSVFPRYFSSASTMSSEYSCTNCLANKVEGAGSWFPSVPLSAVPSAFLIRRILQSRRTTKSPEAADAARVPTHCPCTRTAWHSDAPGRSASASLLQWHSTPMFFWPSRYRTGASLRTWLNRPVTRMMAPVYFASASFSCSWKSLASRPAETATGGPSLTGRAEGAAYGTAVPGEAGPAVPVGSAFAGVPSGVAEAREAGAGPGSAVASLDFPGLPANQTAMTTHAASSRTPPPTMPILAGMPSRFQRPRAAGGAARGGGGGTVPGTVACGKRAFTEPAAAQSSMPRVQTRSAG